MTWTYSGDPSSSSRDLVRFLIGDTTGTPTIFQLVQDEEIDYVLTQQASPAYAAAAICDALANKFSIQVDKSIGQTSISLSQRAEAFRKAADRLRAGGAGTLPGGDGTGERVAVMHVGGLSLPESRDMGKDKNARQPAFSISKDDKPGSMHTTTRDEWDPLNGE